MSAIVYNKRVKTAKMTCQIKNSLQIYCFSAKFDLML